MSISHSTWPVNYNLPPWLNMKLENLILWIIISGPTQLGNLIDAYLQPQMQALIFGQMLQYIDSVVTLLGYYATFFRACNRPNMA